MSYTLRGRIESRLAAAALPLLVACAVALALREWWPVELAWVMLGVGLLLDLAAYHRLLPYQAGWVAVPLGLLELGAVMALVRIDGIEAPLVPALAFFGGSWLLAQVLAHAVFPVTRLTYGEEGGELGRAGPAVAATVLVVLGAAGSVAWATQPPTVRLEAGVHRGDIVIDRAQTLVGEEGTVVEGRILVTADDVTIRDLTVVADQNGIEIDGADDVLIDDVVVRGASLDAISVRRGQATIRDCLVEDPGGPYTQGIDVSFTADRDPSMIEDCTVVGGQEGIVTNSANIHVADNTVRGTTLRAITITEMSMGAVEDNHVEDAIGIGIFCGDYSHCEITGNSVIDIRPDEVNSEGSRQGYGIVAHFYAKAVVEENELVRTRGIGTFAEAEITTH
jgi:nitrous oxidase accessory protein NosD